MKDNQILSHLQVKHKIRRIAFQMYESNTEEEEIVFAGIDEMGYIFAQMLKVDFEQIAPISTRLVRITLDKLAPMQSEVLLDCPLSDLENKTIILLDDVLNTGRTLAYSLKPFLQIPIKKLQVAVLVDRSYRSFPLSPDYVGYELSTTINQHIEVDLADVENLGVYLN